MIMRGRYFIVMMAYDIIIPKYYFNQQNWCSHHTFVSVSLDKKQWVQWYMYFYSINSWFSAAVASNPKKFFLNVSLPICRPNLISWNTSGEWDYPLAIFGLMLDNWQVLGRDTDSHTHIGLQRVIIGSRPTRILDIDSYQPLYKFFTVKVPWPTSLTSS